MTGRGSTLASALLAVALGPLVLLAPACKKPRASTIELNPLECLPPRAEKTVAKGGMALWAMASPDGRLVFYLVPPRGLRPVMLEPHFGAEVLPVQWKQDHGQAIYSWPATLGVQAGRDFDVPLSIDVSFSRETSPRRLLVRGLGNEGYPFLDVLFFDLTWEDGS